MLTGMHISEILLGLTFRLNIQEKTVLNHKGNANFMISYIHHVIFEIECIVLFTRESKTSSANSTLIGP